MDNFNWCPPGRHGNRAGRRFVRGGSSAMSRIVNRYTVGITPMDWSAAMTRIETRGETAIVHDAQQEAEGGTGWDIWLEGTLRCSARSQREAESSMLDLLREADG